MPKRWSLLGKLWLGCGSSLFQFCTCLIMAQSRRVQWSRLVFPNFINIYTLLVAMGSLTTILSYVLDYLWQVTVFISSIRILKPKISEVVLICHFSQATKPPKINFVSLSFRIHSQSDGLAPCSSLPSQCRCLSWTRLTASFCSLCFHSWHPLDFCEESYIFFLKSKSELLNVFLLH